MLKKFLKSCRNYLLVLTNVFSKRTMLYLIVATIVTSLFIKEALNSSNFQKLKSIDLLFYIKQKSVSISLLVILFCLIILYIRKKHTYWTSKGVCTSPPTFIVGHIFMRMGLSMPFMEFFDDLYYNYNGKDFCGFYDFLTPGLFVGNLQLIKNILVKDFDNFSNRITMDFGKVNPIADNMLTNAVGQNWRNLRQVVSPTFTVHKMKHLYSFICDKASKLNQKVAFVCKEGEVIEARDLCGRFTMDSIASSAFGIECNALQCEKMVNNNYFANGDTTNTTYNKNYVNNDQYGIYTENNNADINATTFSEMAAKIFVLSPIRAFRILVVLLIPWLAPWLEKFGFCMTSDEFKFFDNVVKRTLKAREEEKIKRGDFIDIMKDTGMTEVSMTAQSILFLLAGYNNTANTMSMALHLLAFNGYHQEILRNELKMAVEKIPGSQVVLLEGQPVVIPVWSIHRDPEFWNEPEKFVPERFLMETEEHKRLPYLPFGAGPRSCIGINFAMFTVKIGLSHILLQYRISPSPLTVNPPELDPRILTLQPKNGLPLLVQNL